MELSLLYGFSSVIHRDVVTRSGEGREDNIGQWP